MILDLIKASPLKLIVILAIITALVGYVMYRDKSNFDAGYNKAKVEVFEASEKALREIAAAERDRLGEAINEERTKRERAERDAEALRDNPEVKIRNVIKIIESGSCESIGKPVIGLFNRYIGIKPFSGE